MMDSQQPGGISTRTSFRTTWINRLIVSLVILIWMVLDELASQLSCAFPGRERYSRPGARPEHRS